MKQQNTVAKCSKRKLSTQSSQTNASIAEYLRNDDCTLYVLACLDPVGLSLASQLAEAGCIVDYCQN
ncbi:MAG: hypothetical protein MHPSP_002363, partial [Paramarteilia canceri]